MARTNGEAVVSKIITFVVVLVAVFGVVALFQNLPEPTPAEPISYPEPTGYVVDQSDVLSAETESLLTNQLTQLYEATGIQLAVVTLPTTNGVPMPQYSIGLAEYWQPGDADTDKGLIFITATEDRETRLEIGQGLEGVLTDSQAGSIFRDAIFPEFKDNNFETGILNGVGAFIHHITNGQNVN